MEKVKGAESCQSNIIRIAKTLFQYIPVVYAPVTERGLGRLEYTTGFFFSGESVMQQIISSAIMRMTSVEIADMVEKRHDNVKRTIESLAEQGVISFPQVEEKDRKSVV